MNYRKKITYSTGEFAKHFGIKKDTLFFYDKIHLFSPAGVKENGYRYYTASQIEPFRTLLSLRSLNVPIKVLLDYFQEPTVKKLDEISSAQLEQIRIQMEQLEKIQAHLTHISNMIQEAQNAAYDEVQIEHLTSTYLIYSDEIGGSLNTSDEQWEEVQDIFIRNADLSGITNIGSIITEYDIKNENFDRIHRLFAKSAEPAKHLRKEGTYAVYYHKGGYDRIKLAYKKMLLQIADMGYTPVGDSYEEYLVSDTATKNENEYVTKIIMGIE